MIPYLMFDRHVPISRGSFYMDTLGTPMVSFFKDDPHNGGDEKGHHTEGTGPCEDDRGTGGTKLSEMRYECHFS
jgi:hypothetical protein